MLKESFKELEARILSEVKGFYGQRLVSLVVFGSVARETPNFDSDLYSIQEAKKGKGTCLLRRYRFHSDGGIYIRRFPGGYGKCHFCREDCRGGYKIRIGGRKARSSTEI